MSATMLHSSSLRWSQPSHYEPGRSVVRLERYSMAQVEFPDERLLFSATERNSKR